MTADGPGIEIIFILFFSISLINIFPGSDMSGVPASLIRDTILFFLKISNIFSTDSFSLNLWYENNWTLMS